MKSIAELQSRNLRILQFKIKIKVMTLNPVQSTLERKLLLTLKKKALVSAIFVLQNHLLPQNTSYYLLKES